jgi:peptide/nickel transport system permease protein
MSTPDLTLDAPGPAAAPVAGPAARSPHPIRHLLAWRVPLGVLSVAVVAVITYFATRVLPGDAATSILGQTATPERLALVREQLGLNESVVSGFGHWVSDSLSGNYGTSLIQGRPVTDIVMPHLANSAVLVLVVAVVSTVLGAVGGVIAAYWRDKPFDDVTSVMSLVASALPEFVVGVLVVFVFAVGILSWFPAVSILPPEQRIWDQPNKLVLPALTLVIVTTPYMFRMVRAAVIEALNSEYAEVAELKGVSAPRLLFGHALPNAIAPAVQVFGLNVLYLAGGIVLVETVFQYPGIGLTLVNAITGRDVPVLQFIVILLAIFYVTLNILTDVIVLLATPRRRAPR